MICGCGLDLGSMETILARAYECLDCGQEFKGSGWRPECQRCKSRKTRAAKTGRVPAKRTSRDV
jgi:Zn finger protein HypA/HybF involved in hydrogenase expression